MKTTMKLILLAFITILGLIALSLMSTHQHEDVHQKIAEYAGCKGVIHQNFFKQSYTMVTCPENLSMTSAELAMYKYDVELEMFNYKVSLVLNVLAMICLAMLFYWKSEQITK